MRHPLHKALGSAHFTNVSRRSDLLPQSTTDHPCSAPTGSLFGEYGCVSSQASISRALAHIRVPSRSCTQVEGRSHHRGTFPRICAYTVQHGKLILHHDAVHLELQQRR